MPGEVFAHVHYQEAFAALGRLSVQVDEGTRRAVADAAHLVERETKQTLGSVGRHGKGTPTPAPAGGPPAQVTGTLRASVRVEGPTRRGFGDYRASIGPTVVYSRAQELGIADRNLPARPYLTPTMNALSSSGRLAATYRRTWTEATRVR